MMFGRTLPCNREWLQHIYPGNQRFVTELNMMWWTYKSASELLPVAERIESHDTLGQGTQMMRVRKVV